VLGTITFSQEPVNAFDSFVLRCALMETGAGNLRKEGTITKFAHVDAGIS
jgi:hypothetical protein